MWQVWFWAVGAIGVAGVVALAIFAPAVFSLALNAIARLLGLVLSYRIGCAVVAAIVAIVVTDYIRHAKDDAEFARRTAEFEQAQRERDVRIEKQTRELVWQEIANATAENAATDKEVKEFHDALPAVPTTGNSFRVGDDACRLRRIAGQTECGPVRSKRLPKARRKGLGARDQRR